MPSSIGNQRGNVLSIIIPALFAVLLIGILALHFTQKRHNKLPFDADVAFPPGTPLVGGEAFGSTAAAIMDHELHGGSGWRPNDFILWGPAIGPDNNANRQLGIIQSLRESVRVFKDHLTKVSSNEYDPNLIAAETNFFNDPTKFWLPSAESKFSNGVEALNRYVAGLQQTPPTSRPINRRNVELIRLFQTWGDQLGDAHANLFKETEADGSTVATWRTDDYFYHAQGMTHVMYHLGRALKREYADQLAGRPGLIQVLDEVIAALGRAAELKPLVVLDGGPAALFANHRRNLDGYVADARQKLYTLREELEK